MTLSDLTNKTPEELNVMCAELLGWRQDERGFWRNKQGHFGQNQRWAHGVNTIPNYTGSWDAIMPEVRKLKGKQADAFIDFLLVLTDNGTGSAFDVMFLIMTATTQQLTIALILTLTSQH